eukprot:gene20376-7385_t
METIMEHIAQALDKDPEEVREINLYEGKDDEAVPFGDYSMANCTIRDMWAKLKTDFKYKERLAACIAHNEKATNIFR